MAEIIGTFIACLLCYGFVYAVVYIVTSFGINTTDIVVRAALAGDCAIAASILAGVIAYIFRSNAREENAMNRHIDAQNREDLRSKNLVK